MPLTPLLQRLGVVLIGLAFAMGPIAEVKDVTVVFLTGAILLASALAMDFVPTRLRRAVR